MYKYKRYDTTFTDRSSLVKIDAFRVIVVTDTARPPARRPPVLPPQTGLITIHCAAMLSAQCKNTVTYTRLHNIITVNDTSHNVQQPAITLTLRNTYTPKWSGYKHAQ